MNEVKIPILAVWLFCFFSVNLNFCGLTFDFFSSLVLNQLLKRKEVTFYICEKAKRELLLSLNKVFKF